MGRKIILLSDGTGNSSAKVWRTNVWRTYEALDLSGSDQVAFYDDGVGTSSFKPLAILGGAFGFGLKRNVIAIYKFACRNRRNADDKLYGFGFSRGAFTIRIVMGLIANQGLVQAENDSELNRLAHAAYRAYRADRYRGRLRLEAIWQFLCNAFGPYYDKANNQPVDSIAFIGVWDTVSAYGMPIKEMNDGIHNYLWPIELPNDILSEKVERARQALALDEERTTFHPQLWEKAHADPAAIDPTQHRHSDDETLLQVWFAGVHSNVGGGYPDDSLAYIPFVWMITEASRYGLRFKSDHPADPATPVADPDTFKNAVSKRDKDGRIYDPRKGLGGYYRYGPRKLVPDFYPESKKNEGDEVDVHRPKIHESVFKRLNNHAYAYAPVGLPALYDVVRDDGSIVTPDQYGFESNRQAAARAQTQETAWNEIWKRRIVYFASVGATAWLVAFPFLHPTADKAELDSPLRWVSDLIRLLAAFLPNFTQILTEGWARSPVEFVGWTSVVVALLGLNSIIAARINDTMRAIWRAASSAPDLPSGWIYKLRSSIVLKTLLRFWKQPVAPFLSAVLIVFVGGSLLSHALFNVQDVAGWTCRESGATKLEPGEMRTVDFLTSNMCKATGVLLEDAGRYRVQVLATSEWRDGDVPIPYGGFTLEKQPTILQQLKMFAWVPMRREWTRDWFRIVLRYGGTGGEEAFLDPDPNDAIYQARIKPTVTGELFVFVNDAVLGVPNFYDVFYRNNSGAGQIVVTRIR